MSFITRPIQTYISMRDRRGNRWKLCILRSGVVFPAGVRGYVAKIDDESWTDEKIAEMFSANTWIISGARARVRERARLRQQPQENNA